MPKNEEILREKEAFLLDMDGVVHLAGDPIDGSFEAFKEMRNEGKEVGFLTNNSTMSREEYLDRLDDLNVDIDESDIMSSAYAAALRLKELEGGKYCYLIAENGVKEELKRVGFEIVGRENAEKASFVVAGVDRELSYEKLWGGLEAVLSGAKFIATNDDPTYPTPDGLAPGAGASVGALSGCLGRGPEEVIGKPSSYMLEAIMDIKGVSPDETVIVGDRIETDIVVGNKNGLTTVLVLSGVESRENLEGLQGEEKPDFVFDNLKQVSERVVR